MISDKVNKIGSSPTLKISAKAKAMRAEGIDVVDLSLGEPDFPTPAAVKAAGIKAIEQNFTKYTQNEGIPDLKKAVLTRLREDFGLSYEMNQVIVSSGAKSSLYHLLQALVNEGDEVIIPAPYWVTYPEAVALAQAKPVIVPTREENGFRLTADELKAAVTPATKALILNNPSNPTGAAYGRADLEALAAVIKDEDIYVIADEIYAALVYDDFKFTSFAALGDAVKKKTVIVNGVSKAYAMTGWRIGYAAGPADIIAGMAKIQSHSTSNACSISQKASVEALGGPQHEVARMVAEFQRRRNYCLMRLQSVPGISCFKPQGAFYLFPNVSSAYDKECDGMAIRNSYGLSYYLLKQARVALVPGDAFGADDYIRFSYATSMENLEKGMDRILEAMSRLRSAKAVKRVALDNAATRVRKSVPVDAAVPVPVRDGLVAEAEAHLLPGSRFAWNAAINGLVVQLRTNVPHLYHFWMENWWPAALDADLKPHAVVYAVDGIPGREPRAFYNPETQTGVLVNVDGYGPLRSLALGLVADLSARLSGSHPVRGMAADIGGAGLALVGPKGTNKTELFFGLLADRRFRLHAADLAFVRVAGGEAASENPERKLYLPTQTVEADGRLAALFDRSKCENVVTRKDDCQDSECQRLQECRLDRGTGFCYKASKSARALLDPEWLGGRAAYARRTSLRWLFILRKDAFSPDVVPLPADEALRILETGETSGAGKHLTPSKSQPFFDPHLLAAPGRLEAHKAFYRSLLEKTSCFWFNSGVAGADKIREIVGGG
ncbi:MAG: pyridoxal phosphate-dependent aminotransferase, partial [Candidatus Aminicenantes bacterium]|nr:pyridoxal phosphate-dependent aminotransferase [Candidatus Aminicenantes bacterium]